MSIVDEQVAEPKLDSSTFDARKRHRGAFRMLGGGVGAPRPRRSKPRGKISFWLAAGWIGLAVFLAIFANLLPFRNPNAVFGLPNVQPHWGKEVFGLDAVGRSMLSRLVYGARNSFIIAVCTTTVALTIGAAIGLLAVYFRGAVGFVADMLCNVILAIPGLLLLITIACVVKPSIFEIIGSIALLFVPAFTRLTRATALSQIEREYVFAARGLGASPARIILKELLPNTLTSLVTYAGIALPAVMLIEGGLSYVGFGLPAPASSWGEMIAQGQPDLAEAPWQVLIPAIIFALTVLALYTLGDWLRARVDLKGVDNI